MLFQKSLIKNIGSLFFGSFVLWSASFAPITGAASGQSLSEARQIEACIRNEIKSAPAPSIDDLKFGHNWVCEQLNYGRNKDGSLAIAIVRKDLKPIFRFKSNQYTESAGLFDNETPASRDQVHYGYFGHQFMTGFFSHMAPGMPPSYQDYFTFDQNGFLLWEESIENRPFNLKFYPELYQLPLALYLDYPTYDDEDKLRVITYGVCRDLQNPPKVKSPCF